MHRSLTAILLLLGLVACGDGEGALLAHISARVKGQRWTALAAPGFVMYSGANPDDSGLVHTSGLARGNGAGVFFSISFPNPPTPGSYVLDNVTAVVSLEYCPDLVGECSDFVPAPGHPGTLTVTHVDPENGSIEGTFSFPGYSGDVPDPSRSVTQGRFAFLAPGALDQE